ncbi:M23 family metallopeptidase [Thermomonas flagellata]|uniref:M23 family metallopeptidase n=1 Tax=Thermomonas flagellata TaxID=2888524 RepID=UPI001F04A68F
MLPPARPATPFRLRACAVLAALAAAWPTAAAGPSLAASEAEVVLQVLPEGEGLLVVADNRLAGPVEVLLSAPGLPQLAADPALPARATVAAGAREPLARLDPAAGVDPLPALRLAVVPGDPRARPRDVLYQRPVAGGPPRIDQGEDGPYSHADAENRHAVDFAVPVGTPVLAARAGVVMQVEARHRGGGLDPVRDRARANFVRILHDDGSMALYAHLAPGGVRVRPGQAVAAGEPIAWSGNTGYSTGPHLHFAVQVNRGLRLVSIPFRMPGVTAPAAPRAP